MKEVKGETIEQEDELAELENKVKEEEVQEVIDVEPDDE